MKIQSWLLGIGLALAIGLILFTGCEKKASPLVVMKLATGDRTGTYYAYGTALGQILQQRLGLQVTVQTTAASAANIALLLNGGADFAFVQNDIMTYAYNGTNFFSAEGPRKDFSAVAGLYPEVCHIIAAGTIAGIADLKGKRVSVGESGSGTSFNAAQILEVYDMSFEDIKRVNLGFGDSAKALEEGEIDAFFCTAGTPVPVVAGLAQSTKVRFLPMGDARIRLLCSRYPYYAAYTVPAGTYAGLDEDITAVTVQATLVVRNAIQANDVYNVIKALFEHKAGITHPKGAELNHETAVSGIPIPFHPGALKYYRGKGVIK
jgi:TRAP transporter TAXI family solute receptor